MSHTTTSDTISSSFFEVMNLLDQTGIGYEVVYTGPDRSCPYDLAPARAA